ncbi:sugar ABC transporter substrate-binding protein [Pleomorphomonas sp. JP5]|uniref:sugar ABC transporter substrate-binding protein n=1 Tax=Pleomorphomonas sp. JP5 TaxID=2942998 RepID=UPI002044A322|nr:sugar ABC transporter substrate-binding protein [Pleomorphomonas sp. JP5]MCM5558933.1 sugar ABC transporter substrate-binding protein [Pleomorphomonas sp. JP5]
MMKWTTIASVAAVALIGCAQWANAADKPYRIGFMVWDTAQPFYSNMMKAARDTAKAEGVSLDIQGGKADLTTEISLVQQFIAQQVDLILLTASDPKGIVPAVRLANAANIPVIAVNTRVDTSGGAEIVTYVGADDYAFGQIQGKLLAQAIGGKGKVAYIMGTLGMSPQLNRKAGLEDTLKSYPDIKLVETQVANWDSAQALAVTQDFLSKYPEGALDVILDQGPEAVNGANFAVQHDRTDVKFIMGDYPANVRNAILKGTVYGTVNQDPSPQGANAVKDAILWLDGHKDAVPQPNHYLDLPIVTKENADKFPAAWGD